MFHFHFILVMMLLRARLTNGGVLKVTGLNFTNSTSTNSTIVPSSNTTQSTNHNSSFTTMTTTQQPTFKKHVIEETKKSISIKSEIYKMHNNGLMLLHPQRSGDGLGIKKSELLKSDDNIADSVNYHIWKKIDKNNGSVVVENEELLEKKLGNLPQVNEGKRQTITLPDEENKKTVICFSNDINCIDQKRNQISLNRKLRSSDDPLFDDDQPEEVLRQFQEKRRLEKLKTKSNRAYGRNIPDIPPIPAIPNIANKFEKIEPLEHVPRFSDFGFAAENWPRFGVPDVQLKNFPRFPAPKLEEFEQIPGIPHIRELSRGDEVTGDKRGFPAKNDEFYDRELDEDIEHFSPITSPTEIPSLTNIPDIPEISDIPTIKPAAAKQRSGGVNGKMPVVDTINTKDGKETRVSA